VKFSSADALKERLRLDRDQARSVLAERRLRAGNLVV
jgi:hypothetical protein